MSMRRKQQEDEREQFRKAWRRRRTEEESEVLYQDNGANKMNEVDKKGKSRLLQRYASFKSNIAVTESGVVVCR